MKFTHEHIEMLKAFQEIMKERWDALEEAKKETRNAP
jgi:hypothetical protein